MNYDKLNDTLDKKMLDFNLKILALLGSLLIKPLSLATEPFFRKNFGERYFTATGFVISVILWNLAQAATNALNDSPLLQLLHDSHLRALATWGQNHHFTGKMAWVISFIYGWMAMRQYLRVKSRRRNDRTWHSMSRGESIFGYESRGRDILIALLGSFVLSIVAPVIGFLFFASQCASIYLASKTESSFYNRYLDIVDAKLENEFMQKCLERGEPPTDVNGLFYPLPKAIQGEARMRVARVVAGMQFASNAPGAVQPNPQLQPKPAQPHQSAAATSDDKNLISELRSELATLRPVLDDAVKTARKRILSAKEIPGVKSLVRIVLAVSVILIVVILCYRGFGLVKSHWPAHPQAPVGQQVTPSPVTTPATSLPVVAPQPVSVTTTTVVSPEVPAKAQELPPQAVPPQINFEKQRQEELAKIASARQLAIDKIESRITAEQSTLDQFEAQCRAILNDNTNKLAKVAYFSRKRLTRQNDEIRTMMAGLLAKQRTFISARKQFPDLQSPDINPAAVLQGFEAVFSDMAGDRKAITKALVDLDAAIANAPAKGSLFRVDIK